MEAVGRLAAVLVRGHHAFDPLRFIEEQPDTARSYAGFLARQLREEDVIVLVAERGGEIIGYTYAGIEGYDYMSLRGPAGALYDIVVDPAQQQHGVGRALLEATVAELKAHGAP